MSLCNISNIDFYNKYLIESKIDLQTTNNFGYSSR